MAQASPTQRVLDPNDVARLVAVSFGPHRQVSDCGPMSGGTFAAVWWVRLDDQRTVVLKASPPSHVPLLGYERGLAGAEAAYYRVVAQRAPAVPVPRVLHHGSDPQALDSEWLFLTMLPGRPLTELAPGSGTDPVRRDLGAALAAVHTVSGDRFGYDGGRVAASSWRAAFTGMVVELLDDATTWEVELPVPADRIRLTIDRHGDLLDLVDRPALLHVDGWDGNVLAAADAAGTLRLSGLVDGERYLYGDPLMDFVAPALFRRIEDEPEHPFLLGYADATRAPRDLDVAARRRLALYRTHLYLLMIVEAPSRGIARGADGGRYERLAELLVQELTELGR